MTSFIEMKRFARTDPAAPVYANRKVSGAVVLRDISNVSKAGRQAA